MGRRGDADGLPLGRFAVPDPDDESRMTFWRVEPDGKHRALRPWPHDVRWAPLRPPYPPDLDVRERRMWAQEWYEDVYFEWKSLVIASIAADPQSAANAFDRLAPDAELPEPVKKRPRVRVPARSRPVSAKRRQMAAEALMAEALARVGMSERAIAVEMQLARSTVQRRLARPAQASDEIGRLLLESRLAGLVQQVGRLEQVSAPGDVDRLRHMLERIRLLQAQVAGLREVDSQRLGVSAFGGLLGGDA